MIMANREAYLSGPALVLPQPSRGAGVEAGSRGAVDIAQPKLDGAATPRWKIRMRIVH